MAVLRMFVQQIRILLHMWKPEQQIENLFVKQLIEAAEGFASYFKQNNTWYEEYQSEN